MEEGGVREEGRWVPGGVREDGRRVRGLRGEEVQHFST